MLIGGKKYFLDPPSSKLAMNKVGDELILHADGWSAIAVPEVQTQFTKTGPGEILGDSVMIKTDFGWIRWRREFLETYQFPIWIDGLRVCTLDDHFKLAFRPSIRGDWHDGDKLEILRRHADVPYGMGRTLLDVEQFQSETVLGFRGEQYTIIGTRDIQYDVMGGIAAILMGNSALFISDSIIPLSFEGDGIVIGNRVYVEHPDHTLVIMPNGTVMKFHFKLFVYCYTNHTAYLLDGSTRRYSPEADKLRITFDDIQIREHSDLEKMDPFKIC